MNLIKNKVVLLLLVLVISLASSAAYFFYDRGKQAVRQEVTIQQQQSYIDTRKRIDEATRTTGTVDDALNRLRERQSRRNDK
jgi:hypothetical protein